VVGYAGLHNHLLCKPVKRGSFDSGKGKETESYMGHKETIIPVVNE